MKSPFPGVMPPELDEADAKVVWPSIGANPLGRFIARLCASKIGLGGFFTLGKVWAVVTIPLSVCVFFWQLLPYICRRYALTNRRVIVRRGLQPLDSQWVDLDGFDKIEVKILPGQEWLHAGDLIFKNHGAKVLLLSGVSRPESFRQTCLDARQSFVSVRETLHAQSHATVPPTEESSIDA